MNLRFWNPNSSNESIKFSKKTVFWEEKIVFLSAVVRSILKSSFSKIFGFGFGFYVKNV